MMAVAFLQPGTIVGWLTLAILVIGGYYFRSAGGGTAIESLEVANRVLEKRVKDLEDQVASDAKTIAELRGRTDVAVALKPLFEWQEKHDAQVIAWSEAHEARAQERHDKTIEVLNQIVAKLAPTPKPRARRAA